MKKITLFIALCIGTVSFAQTNFWSKTESVDTRTPLQFRKSMPTEFQLYNLQLDDLKQQLSSTLRSSNQTVLVDFPLPNGKTETFRVQEHSTMQPDLQSRYSNIRTYKGVSLSKGSTVIHFSTSPRKGFSGMILSPDFSTQYIDLYTRDRSTFIAYQRNNLPASLEEFSCEVFGESKFNPDDLVNTNSNQRNANDGTLRTYRLALACTGEYSIFHLDAAGIPITDITTPDSEKKAVVMEALIESMVRVNGLYERDFAIRMIIVDGNDDIIYLNPATDPHTNNDSVSMLATNQTDIDMKIGQPNYDIGHVYSTGAGGVAYLGVPCDDSFILNRKAGGVTGIGTPTGDPFWVDYVAHEIGHQFGANHTQNNDCQRNGSTSMEPGSASTILGYAGICSPNVQNNSDDHFHAVSIQEITNFMLTQNCEVQTPTNNVAPTAIAPQDFTIPASTPFRLDAVGIDNDTPLENLTYNWEQFDNEIGEVMPPASTNTQGPMFRSKSSLSSPTRFMPDIPTVLAGQTANMWEVLPSVSRTMDFRVTVKDNELNGGATASDNVLVTVDDSSGPFVITSQNTATTWAPNSPQTITWDVANTDQAPISTSNVNIVFSADGGQTYPTTLASNVPNNGAASITAPNFLTNTGRIRVEPVGNHYYDVNDADVTIDGVLAVEDTIALNDLSIHPNPTNGIVNINFTPLSQETINVSLFDVRGRQIQTESFENNGAFSQKLNYNSISNGVYFVKISVGNESITKKLIIE